MDSSPGCLGVRVFSFQGSQGSYFFFRVGFWGLILSAFRSHNFRACGFWGSRPLGFSVFRLQVLRFRVLGFRALGL